MAAAEMSFLHSQLEERKRRLETVVAAKPDDAALEALLREVDSALDRFAAGVYGLCESAMTPWNATVAGRSAHSLLPRPSHQGRAFFATARSGPRRRTPARSLAACGSRVDGWETSYHYAPLGPVSGDYCDLYPHHGQLFFMLGDVSGKGVAASMRMTQLHALFRSLIGMGLPLAEIVGHINCFLCDSGLAGQYATLVCGSAKPAAKSSSSTPAICP